MVTCATQPSVDSFVPQAGTRVSFYEGNKRIVGTVEAVETVEVCPFVSSAFL